MSHSREDGPELHTLGILEELRNVTRESWNTSSDLHSRVDELLRELANPNLHDIPMSLPYRIDMWDRHEQHIRLLVAACTNVTIAHGAFEAAVKNYPNEHFTLRQGMLVIRQHKPQS